LRKKKNSLALFEVIAKGRASNAEPDVGVPGWMKDVPPPPDSAGSEVPQASAPDAESAKPDQAAGEPVVSTADGRLTLSLSYTAATLTVTALIVLVAGAFWLGLVSGGHVQPSPRDAAAVAGGLADAGQGAAADVPKRQAGKYYMVIQDLQGSSAQQREEAERIVSFLAERGEAAEVRTLTAGGDYVVWSFKAFDTTDGPDVGNYADWIERLGGDYFDKHRTYRFGQHRDGKLNALMLPAGKDE
jgi:hypothetical protein